MTLEVKHFKDLLGMHFNIPSYQRGYRWGKKQVKELLEDIVEFSKKLSKQSGEFYCLQPIVVCKNEKLSKKHGHDVYDLIDGQQRLTTMWLILQTCKSLWDMYDNKHNSLFTIDFESRDNILEKAIDPDSDKSDNIDLYYMKEVVETIIGWQENIDPDSDKFDNIDLYYMKEVVETIIGWQEKLQFIQTTTPTTFDHNSNDLRVIWYEVESGEDSIDIFTRLNYGKIPLTYAELIKARLLVNDIYPATGCYSKDIMREKLFQISCEWDEIEKNLHNDELWSMIAPKSYNPINRIELILHFVARKFQTEETKTDRNIFDTISEQFKDITDPIDYAQKVSEIWTIVKDTYNTLYNWYKNSEYYHLIGLYMLLQEGKKPIRLVEEVYDLYNTSETKTVFVEKLKKKIGEVIKITEKEGEKVLQLDELRYNEHNNQIIKILQLLNIYLHLTDKHIDKRFNFKLYKKYDVTSLEHIHPQHLELSDKTKYCELKKWFENYEEIFSGSDKNDEIQEHLTSLKTLISDKQDNDVVSAECHDIIKDLEDLIDKNADIKEEHIHTIRNLALLDRDTNSALSNNTIDIKRRILKERSEKGNTYIPIATEYVFNKWLTDNISDMRYWGKKDREAYYKIIETAYDYFVK